MKRLTTLTLILGLHASISVAQTASSLTSGDSAGTTSSANRSVTNFRPYYCWSYSGSGSQQNWQIQVDDDPNFALENFGAGSQPFFWDSGDADKSASNSSTCVQHRSFNGSGLYIDADARPELVFWRVRVKDVGGWGSWTSSDMMLTHYPNMPQSLGGLHSDPNASSDPGAITSGAVSGSTYYVDPNTGSNGNDGSAAHPWLTLTYATQQLQAADTLIVKDGTFAENLVISNTTHASGSAANPITVKADVGATVVLTPSTCSGQPTGRCTGLRVTPTTNSALTDWVFKGITLGGISGSNVGAEVVSGTNIVFQQIQLHSSLDSSHLAGIDIGGGEDIKVLGCTFDRPVQDQVHVGDSPSGVMILQNDFTAFNKHGIQMNGAGRKPAIIEDNVFHDSAANDGAIFLYLGSAGTRIYGNEFRNISGGAGPWGIGIQRSGQIWVEKNTFYDMGTGIMLLREAGFTVIRNNILAGCTTAVGTTGDSMPGGTHNGALIDYNLFHDNSTDISGSISSGNLAHSPAGNCYNCDPDFVDAPGGDLRIGESSLAIDMGYSSSPVPWDGGSQVDAGRYEYGAGDPPYHFYERSESSDSTPKFTWAIHDVDNAMPAGAQVGNGLTYHSSAQAQAKYQIQIDPYPSFDSVGTGRPLYDSGLVTSANQRHTVPNSAALPNGYYYWRVRQTDGVDPAKGAWSDNNRRLFLYVEGGGEGGGGGGHPFMYQ